MLMRKLKNDELNRISVSEFKQVEKVPVIIVLDNIRSLNNIGSIFRTSDAFRVEQIYLCGITACPPHREIQKTALGATDSVVWKYFDHTFDAIKNLKEEAYTVYAVEQVDDSQSLETFSPTTRDRIAFVFGNEIQGVEEEVVKRVDGCIEIPQFGTKHSFNVSISVGIILWHHFIKCR